MQGKLENGQIFDASKEEPIKFQLGEGRVIKGWDKGISGMCVGEKRKLVIPSDLAYGANGVKGVIPRKFPGTPVYLTVTL